MTDEHMRSLVPVLSRCSVGSRQFYTAFRERFPADDASARSCEKLRASALTLLPPLRPALAASFGLVAKARFSFGTLRPPLLAISLRRAGSIDAKPCRDFGLLVSICGPCLKALNY